MMEPIDEVADEAFDTWGAAAAGVDPLWASFTSEPYTGTRPHIPFYRYFAYPDVLDLRRAGYEVDRFAPLFDKLEDALYSQAVQVHHLLHFHQDNAQRVWNPRRSREIEFEVRGALHRFGLSDLPPLLRRMLGRAFSEDTTNYLAIDLINVFFWAALGEIARDYAWREPVLAAHADYLAWPLRHVGIEPQLNV
jgi:hypothetical protein